MEGGFSCSALRAHKQVTCERAGGVQVRWRGGQFARWRGRFSCVREGGGVSYVREGGGGVSYVRDVIGLKRASTSLL